MVFRKQQLYIFGDKIGYLNYERKKVEFYCQPISTLSEDNRKQTQYAETRLVEYNILECKTLIKR